MNAAAHRSAVPFPTRAHLDLHEELHARPAMPVRSPGVVSYWAQQGMESSTALAALRGLCRHVGHAEPPDGARHFVLTSPQFDLKFERHGEFISWQVCAPLAMPGSPRDAQGLQDALLVARAVDALPAEFVQAIATTPMVAAAHVVVLKGMEPEWLTACAEVLQAALAARASGRDRTPTGSAQDGPADPVAFPTAGPDDRELEDLAELGDAAALLASRISDGQAAVLTDLRLAGDGFIRFVLVDQCLTPDRLARDVQRLCEIEAYRMLAMLGFPVARTEAVSLNHIESQLQQIVDDMANARSIDDAAAFDSLLRLAAEIEHGAARTRYRLSATRAYHRIVLQRLADLREERLLGLQKLAGFFTRRFAPAMALCESTDARITDIAERINRAVDLARVRVEAQREANNQELLSSLAHRAKLQLRLQQTVEGLSVVAISYYSISIVAYMAKALDEAVLPGGWVLDHDVITAVAVIPVVGAVYAMVRRVRRHLEH